MVDASFHEFTFAAHDGLRLSARHYRSRTAGAAKARPVLCLAGLTRNSRDFHDLAVALSGDPWLPRDVYTIDYRGRGRSERDPDWRKYTPLIETHDVIDFLFRSGLHDVAVVGTSRGGLIAMVLAAIQPSAVGAVVLNDIGPVIERDGLARIAGYVGRAPLPGSWAEASKMVREMNHRHFPAVTETQWDEVARAWFNERNGRPAPGYDANLANALSVLDAPVASLWKQFEALKRVPVLAIRGEHSDILSAATLNEMRKRHPDLSTVNVKGQGHAPLLKDAATVSAIRDFLCRTDPGAVAANQQVA